MQVQILLHGKDEVLTLLHGKDERWQGFNANDGATSMRVQVLMWSVVMAS